MALVLGGAWATPAQAQTDNCPADQPDGCCDPRQSIDEDQEEGINADCPPAEADGGRAHRRGGDGDDALVEENDTGSVDDDAVDSGSFGSGGRLRRGSGNRNPADGDGSSDGSAGQGDSGAGDSSASPGGGAGSALPGGGVPGGTPSGPRPGAVSSPGARSPAAGPSVAGGGTGSGAVPGSRSAAGGRSGAGAGAGGAGTATAGGSIARTGPDVDIPLGLAVTLLATGVSLRRWAARPRSQPPERRRPVTRRRRPARPPVPATTTWSYLDHSSSARAIEKF